MKFLIIDNYDSFVYNIAQRLGELGITSDVIRNDKITIKDIKNSNYDAIVISPGPGTPDDERYFGVCKKVIMELGPVKPILGVCLGHQSIGQAFGAKIIKADKIMHGKTSEMENLSSSIFKGLPKKFHATRYHSLIIKKNTLPDYFKIISKTTDNGKDVIMGIEHKEYPCFGVQFHPESIASVPYGKKIMKNFLKL